jgi:sugar lactone lactonase YvrE
MKIAVPALALILSFGAWTSATAQSFPETIPLPNQDLYGFQPEGITLGHGSTAYVGSLADGSIYEADLRTGEGRMLVQGSPGLMLTVGLDFDESSGYLFAAGGIFGDARIYDTKTGELVDRLVLGMGEPSWINDVVVTRDAAYFTDSFGPHTYFGPHIYKVPLDSQGAPIGPVQPLRLVGDWFDVFPTSPEELVINANGIVATPDNGTLIVVNSASGRLYTVDPDTGIATEINLGGVGVPYGDGLVLRGKTLYVVQNLLNQVSVFTLSPDYSVATYTHSLTSGGFDTPSTADLFGPWLYVVNARFSVCMPLVYCPPIYEFNVVRVDQ